MMVRLWKMMRKWRMTTTTLRMLMMRKRIRIFEESNDVFIYFYICMSFTS
jgi:hypothetical protein